MKHFKYGRQVDTIRLSGGKSVPQIPMDNARKNLLYYLTFRQFGQLLSYQGYPSDATGAFNINGAASNDFYVIFPVVEPTEGTEIRIGVEATHWDYVYLTGAINATWDGVASDNIAGAQAIASTTQMADATAPPNGWTLRDSKKIQYNANQVGGLGFVKFHYERLSPAFVKFFSMPLTFPEFEALDPDWSAQQRYLSDDTFNVGQTIRGCDAVDSAAGSLGELCQAQGTREDDSNILDSAAPCLFQWGHPSGKFMQTSNTTLAYIDVFGHTIQVKPRGLKGTDVTQSSCNIGVVIRGDSGAKIKITSSQGSTETTLTSTYTTPTLLDLGNLSVDPSGDALTFEAYVNDVTTIEFQTIAVFEKY